MSESKANVLLVGAGGLGTMAAYALEKGNKASVTAVLRSNYSAVRAHGFDLDSHQYGKVAAWRPTSICQKVPEAGKDTPFDYVVVTMKNVPDAEPSVADVVAPAVTPGHTAIVLSQNGLNIEKPVIARFPANPVISSISYANAAETSPGKVYNDNKDAQRIGPFPGQSVDARAAARRYVGLYNPEGKMSIRYEEDVMTTRWGKLLYNASYNPISTILRMDTPRIRTSPALVDALIRPLMLEIVAAASACHGVHLGADLVERVIVADPTDTAFKPSMCQDLEKGNLLEVENILGEPLREGEGKGVSMPVLRTVYALCRGLQEKTMEEKGLWKARFEKGNPYQ